MYIIEIALKHSPSGFSVQREAEDAAKADYENVLAALKSGGSDVVELSCDRQTGKKVAILGSEIAAVQLYDKSASGAPGGRTPGFFAVSQ